MRMLEPYEPDLLVSYNPDTWEAKAYAVVKAMQVGSCFQTNKQINNKTNLKLTRQAHISFIWKEDNKIILIKVKYS